MPFQLLILIDDRLDPVTGRAPGHPICVKDSIDEEGRPAVWGSAECPPLFGILECEDKTRADFEAFMGSHMKWHDMSEQEAYFDIRHQSEWCKYRHRFDWDKLPEAIKEALSKEGRAKVRWSEIEAFLLDDATVKDAKSAVLLKVTPKPDTTESVKLACLNRIAEINKYALVNSESDKAMVIADREAIADKAVDATEEEKTAWLAAQPEVVVTSNAADLEAFLKDRHADVAACKNDKELFDLVKAKDVEKAVNEALAGVVVR